MVGLLNSADSLPDHFVCETLTALCSAVRIAPRIDENAVVATIVTVVNKSSSLHTRRCALGVLVTLGELGARLDAAGELLVSLCGDADVFVSKAVLWLLASREELHVAMQKVDVALLATAVLSNDERDKTVHALQWRLLRRLRATHRSGWAELDVAAFNLFTTTEQPLVVFEVSEFLGEAVRESAPCVNSLIDLVARGLYRLEGPRLDLLAVIASVKGAEVAQLMITNEQWHHVFQTAKGQAASAAARLAAASLAADSKLLAYLTHAGLFTCLPCVERVDPALIQIVRYVQEAVQTSALNHYEAALDWMQTLARTVENDLKNQDQRLIALDLIQAVSATLRENGRELIDGEQLAKTLIQLEPSPLVTVEGCNVLVQLLRVPGTVPQTNWADLVSMMGVHETVCVPDGVRIGTSAGSALFVAQMRLVAVWTGICESVQVRQAYSDWFCWVWRRALLIVPSKQTSPVPVLTELACGLIEVLGKSEDLVDSCWGPPISHVLSYVTQTASVPAHLFSLCLSVAEAASSILVNKAVTARVMAALAEQHAVIHGNNVPKDQAALAKAVAVIRLCASLVGCKLTAAEVLTYIDGWIEASGAVESEVLLRVVSCAVLAGGHCRQAVVASELIMEFVMEQSRQDLVPSLAELAAQTLEVIRATSFKNTQTVGGSGG